jgi:signal transduction histidine kinase
LNEAFPTGFQILLRSPDDVFVLRAAPWWTPRRLLAALVIGSAVLGAMILWAWQLRRQLNRKTHELATEMHKRRDAAIEFEATLRERNRLAGNLHDTLLQSISALNYQLEACEVESVPPAERKVNYLQSARRIVQRAQQDLRGTVWALRVLPLHDRTFAEALQTLANQLTEGRDVKIIVETDHALPLLSEFVAGNLLLVAQEAMHNALKHAHPTRIEAVISGAANGGTVTIDIRDNGTGFKLAATSQQNPGHFGLAGMRERIERLGGKLKIESQPGKGTQVHVEVPVREFDDELASQ